MKTRITTYVTRLLVASAFVLLSFLNYGQQISSVPDCTNPPAISLGEALPVCPEEGWINLTYSGLEYFNSDNGNLIIDWDLSELAEFDYDGPAADYFGYIHLGPAIYIQIPDVVPGTYTGKVILTNAEGCSSIENPFSVTIKDPLTAPTVVIEVVNGKVMEDGSIQICGEGSITVTATGDEGSEYRWYQNGFMFSQNNIFTMSFFTPLYLSETYTYEVSQSLYNGNCESARTAISITHSKEPYPGSFNPNNIICTGLSKQVEVWFPPDAGGTWSSSNEDVAIVEQNGVVTGVGEGEAVISYSVTGTGACSTITATSSVTFKVFDNYAEITGNNGTVCNGETAEFYLDAPAGRYLYYTINNGEEQFYYTEESNVIRVDNVQQDITLNLLSVGYNVYCTKDLTGEPTASSTVNVSSPPSVIVVPATSDIDEGNSVELTASGADTYIWSPADRLSATTGTVVMATPLKTTTYSVTGTINDGCSSSAYASVYVRELCKNSPDQYEPNNSMANAGFVVPVGIKIAANLLNSKDVDWFGLFIDANGTYMLSLQNPNGTKLPAAALYNTAGRSLKSIDRANPNSYYLSTGWYYIKVSAKGLKSYLCYTLEVVYNATVTGLYASEDEDLVKSAIIEPTEDGICTIWPNPTKNEFKIFNGSKFPMQMIVIDVTGRRIETIENVGIAETIVFGSKYKPGIYIVNTSQNGVQKVFKLIKQ